MKRSTYALLTGTLAFGLTAAAAAGTAFTISSVQDVGSTDSATIAVGSSPCTGTYAISWTFDSFGYVTGFDAERTPPAGSDDNLPFCADMPASLTVTNSGTEIATFYGNTDAQGELLAKQFTTPSALVLNSYTVTLQIGPNIGI